MGRMIQVSDSVAIDSSNITRVKVDGEWSRITLSRSDGYNYSDLRENLRGQLKVLKSKIFWKLRANTLLLVYQLEETIDFITTLIDNNKEAMLVPKYDCVYSTLKKYCSDSVTFEDKFCICIDTSNKRYVLNSNYDTQDQAWRDARKLLDISQLPVPKKKLRTRKGR